MKNKKKSPLEEKLKEEAEYFFFFQFAKQIHFEMK
jgi:hypothetical protein